jgi:hypothetical protein
MLARKNFCNICRKPREGHFFCRRLIDCLYEDVDGGDANFCPRRDGCFAVEIFLESRIKNKTEIV